MLLLLLLRGLPPPPPTSSSPLVVSIWHQGGRGVGDPEHEGRYGVKRAVVVCGGARVQGKCAELAATVATGRVCGGSS